MTRVAVTTAIEGSEVVAGALAAHGLEPILLPCIAVRPEPESLLDRVRREAAGADLILVTSARAIWITWPCGGMPKVPVAAVGPATAHAVELAGGSVAAVGPSGAAELVAELDVAGRRVVFPHARAADPATEKALITRGAIVRAVAVYETVPVSPGPDPVEGALFGSPLAVAGWSISRDFESVLVGAIGTTTARTLREQGVTDQVVPSRPGFTELVRAMAERLGG